MLARRVFSALMTTSLMLGITAVTALADSQMITLDNANPGLNTGAGGCCTGPYAVVTINRTDTTHATVTFDSLTNGGFTYLIGSERGAGVNVSGSFDLSGITGVNSLSGFSFDATSDLSDGGANNMSSFGDFNQTISFFDGFTHTVTELQFTLTATNGNSWSSAADVLTNNASGFEVVYHGFACASSAGNPCTGNTGATSTGFASTGGAAVPEPTSLYLSGALVGLLAVVSRFRGRSTAE
jgi:hypothetical protein